MTEHYIESDSINVFPCANRENYKHNRWFTEYNLINIINRLVDEDKFVVTTSISDNQTDFMFNIHGYLFTTTVSNLYDLLSKNGTYHIYAGIRVKQSDVNDSFMTPFMNGGPFLSTKEGETEDLDAIDTSDNISKFYGVEFRIYDTTSTNDLNAILSETGLHILTVVKDNNGCTSTIPPKSKIKFVTDNTRRSITIDDGELS